MKRSKGRPPYVENDKDLNTAKLLSIAGIDKGLIARVIGISKPILYLHYKKQMLEAKAQANGAVVSNLFRLASKGDNPTAAIFWCKTQLRWREIHGVELAGKNGTPLQPIIQIVSKDASKKC